MSIKDAWKDFSGRNGDRYSITEIPAPQYNPGTVNDCRKICKQNVCHCFGTNWGCPPGVGDSGKCTAAVSSFRKCALLTRRYEIPIKERTAVDRAASEVQNELREFNTYLRNHGYRTLALADQGCNYCEKCTYPEPCSHPDMMIPSMGGYGVMITDYLEGHGIEIPFEEDAVTIRYLVLFDDSHTF